MWKWNRMLLLTHSLSLLNNGNRTIHSAKLIYQFTAMWWWEAHWSICISNCLSQWITTVFTGKTTPLNTRYAFNHHHQNIIIQHFDLGAATSLAAVAVLLHLHTKIKCVRAFQTTEWINTVFTIWLDIVQISEFSQEHLEIVWLFLHNDLHWIWWHTSHPHQMCVASHRMYKYWFTFQHLHRSYVLF